MPGRTRNLIALFVVAIVLASPASRFASPTSFSAESLRTNLSYLTSDALEGRGTPSSGLDLAASFIATQFRGAGLEPAAPDYFQSARFYRATANMSGFSLTLASARNVDAIPAQEVRARSLVALDLADAPILKLPDNGAMPSVTGRIVAGDELRYGDEVLLNDLIARKPALILIVGKTDNRPSVDDALPPGVFLREADTDSPPIIRIRRSSAEALLRQSGDLRVSLHLAQPALQDATLRNVAGLLRGSDPVLRDRFLLVTAHYDHLGRDAHGEVFEGANDNASGTVSVIAIAQALATMNPHPGRSILFMALFGEEEGLLGSYYYAHHPLVPLKNTLADINLEQMGRTDDPGGRHLAEFAFSGPSYSNIPALMSTAAKSEGIKVYTRKDADDYFDRSDNFAFAQFGIIAHTVAVAFEYPDYHALGDKVGKIDFANMAAVDRGVAVGILALANSAQPPKWSNAPAAGTYKNAGR